MRAFTVCIVCLALPLPPRGAPAPVAAGATPTTVPARAEAALPQPAARTNRVIEGWTVRVDDRLLEGPNKELGRQALRFLEAKLGEIAIVVPPEPLERLRAVRIVLDLNCGGLGSMAYHPSAEWLTGNGYPADLAKCVHAPQAADLRTRRNVAEQPWVVLHELAHAYHDQVLGFDEPRIRNAYGRFKQRAEAKRALLYDGRRVPHYGLTNEKEFFAEMSETFFGTNDFYPFNRAELREWDSELHDLLSEIWVPQK